MRSTCFFIHRKKRWEKVLRKCAAMRAAKEMKRLADPPPEYPPKWERCFPLEIGVRDKRTGDTAWVDFKSVRDATRRLSVIQRFYL